MSPDISEIEKLAGRVVIAGFEGVSIPDDLAEALKRGALGGVILFRRNVRSAEQVAALLGEIRRMAPPEVPVITGVDQEGGRVVRIGAPLTVLPPARRFGEVGDPGLTERAGQLVGRELRALGFTIDFAPVLDVDTNPSSPVIGDRSFGATPDQVTTHAIPFARGLRDGGVVPCAKHFPGHGDADLDSHLSLPRVEHDRERLERIEMAPFSVWARTGLGPIMTAHVVYPALDPENPATSSTIIVNRVLRERLRFSGPVLSDDLEMGAVEALGGAGEVAVRAMRAGVDGLLVCRRREAMRAVIEALTRAAERDPAFTQRLKVAAERLEPIANPPGPAPPWEWMGSDEHRSLQAALLSDLEGDRA